MKMKETEVKYFAGLIDADGCINVGYVPKRNNPDVGYLRISLTLKQGAEGRLAVERLAEVFQYKVQISKCGRYFCVAITSRKKLRAFADRLCKFMVVKGKPLREILDRYGDVREVSRQEFRRIQEEVRKLREQGGPVKPRNFVGNAWIAGFLDGDGNYCLRKGRCKLGKASLNVNINVTVKKREKLEALMLLQKTLGGSLIDVAGGKVRWRLGLGKGNRSRALRLLPKLRKFSMIKKAKISKIISFHSSHRLNPSGRESGK